MIWNLGSINVDNVYTLPHLPGAGETLAATGFQQGLGGKGANMSVAAARAAARVVHIGAVGRDGVWARDRLLEYGVDTQHIHTVNMATGHANISVDADGENSIVLFPGANDQLTKQMIGAALTEASSGSWVMMQNETSGQAYAAQTAKTLGLKVAYAAAPFEVDAVRAVLEHIDLLVLNAIEAEQLTDAVGCGLSDLPIADIVVTLGADGCEWVSKQHDSDDKYDAYPVKAVDTTGAGDTFTGYLIASLDRGLEMDAAIDLALRAGALMVTRHGTADVIPDLKEIQDHDFS
jgi:ribokinase